MLYSWCCNVQLVHNTKSLSLGFEIIILFELSSLTGSSKENPIRGQCKCIIGHLYLFLLKFPKKLYEHLITRINVLFANELLTAKTSLLL